jgi:TetR/AcrR family transcriptional repressor of nem operon
VEKIVTRLEAPDACKQVIFDHFEDLIERAASDRTRRGCLLTNTAIELCPHDADTAKRIATNLERIENAFYHALQRAVAKGELKDTDDLKALARYLTCTLQGLRVICKVNPNREVLKDITQIALSVLN